jgi:hypothetical protein
MKNQGKLPLFSLGDIHLTKRAEAELTSRAVTSATLLERYVTGDWSNLSAEDIKANRAAIHDGGRVLSSYRIAPTVRIWIVSEADRASATILLPTNTDPSAVSPNGTGPPPPRPEIDRRLPRQPSRKSVRCNDSRAATTICT